MENIVKKLGGVFIEKQSLETKNKLGGKQNTKNKKTKKNTKSRKTIKIQYIKSKSSKIKNKK
jgi:hypothetical protein